MVGTYNYTPETIQFVLHGVNLQTPTAYIQHVALDDRTGVITWSAVLPRW